MPDLRWRLVRLAEGIPFMNARIPAFSGMTVLAPRHKRRCGARYADSSSETKCCLNNKVRGNANQQVQAGRLPGGRACYSRILCVLTHAELVTEHDLTDDAGDAVILSSDGSDDLLQGNTVMWLQCAAKRISVQLVHEVLRNLPLINPLE